MKGFIALVLSVVAATGMASAQDFQPGKPISIVVPFPAGGVTDGMARLIAEKMAPTLGVPVVIDNVGGGGGTIGVGKVARAAPDGHSLILGNLETHVTNAIAVPANYDVFTDFEPVTMMPSYPFLLVSKNEVPAKNLLEFFAWLKVNQDKVFQGTVGAAGSAQHLCGVRWQDELKMKWSFVPYRGGAPAMQDMMAGQFDIMCTATGSFLPLVQAGKIKAYAVTQKTRLAIAPDIPTVDEAGFPGFHAGVWNAMWTSKGTPKPLIARLQDSIAKALNDPPLRQRLIDMGLDLPTPEQMPPEYLAKLQKSEADLWWPITKKALADPPK